MEIYNRSPVSMLQGSVNVVPRYVESGDESIECRDNSWFKNAVSSVVYSMLRVGTINGEVTWLVGPAVVLPPRLDALVYAERGLPTLDAGKGTRAAVTVDICGLSPVEPAIGTLGALDVREVEGRDCGRG